MPILEYRPRPRPRPRRRRRRRRPPQRNCVYKHSGVVSDPAKKHIYIYIEWHTLRYSSLSRGTRGNCSKGRLLCQILHFLEADQKTGSERHSPAIFLPTNDFVLNPRRDHENRTQLWGSLTPHELPPAVIRSCPTRRRLSSSSYPWTSSLERGPSFASPPPHKLAQLDRKTDQRDIGQPNIPQMSVSTSRPSPRSSLEFPLSNGQHSQNRPAHISLPAPVHPATAPPPTTSVHPLVPSSGAVKPPKSQNVNSQNSGGGGYFGLVIESTDNQPNPKNNWSSSGSSVRSTAARSPRPVQLDNVSTLFQKQSEAIAMSLQLGRTNSMPHVIGVDYTSGEHFDDRSSFSPLAPGSYVHPLQVPATPDSHNLPQKDSFFTAGPTNRSKLMNGTFTASFERGIGSFTRQNDSLFHASVPPLPPSALSAPSLFLQRKKSHGRSATLPNPPKEGEPVFVSVSTLSELLDRKTSSLLLLDVRTFKVFSQSRIARAVNLCIPTTLLKRPSFNVTKLSETFAKDEDKERFAKWKDMKYIVVYDSDSKDTRDTAASAPLHTLSKFIREGWTGQAYVLKGLYASLGSMFKKKNQMAHTLLKVVLRNLPQNTPNKSTNRNSLA